MKNYVKNAFWGFMIGLLLIPITFVELYYAGGQNAYLSEIAHFNNYIYISTIIPVYTLMLGVIITIFLNLIFSYKEQEWDFKSSLIAAFKLLVSLLILILLVYLISQLLMNKVSESIQILIECNSMVSMILAAIIYVIKEGIEIRKINKKLKENKNK